MTEKNGLHSPRSPCDPSITVRTLRMVPLPAETEAAWVRVFTLGSEDQLKLLFPSSSSV